MAQRARFESLEIGEKFHLSVMDRTGAFKIAGRPGGYDKPCPKCGEPPATWINSEEDYESRIGMHVCPDTVVIAA